MSVRQGEIYYYDFGKANNSGLQGGKRPVLVIQGDAANAKSSTTVVAAMTTRINKLYLRSHILLGAETGLKKPSMVLLEQVRTAPQDELTELIGCVENTAQLEEITEGLRRLYARVPGKKRCLCRRCVQRYIDDERFSIRRIAGGGKCEFCPKNGQLYIIQRIG